MIHYKVILTHAGGGGCGGGGGGGRGQGWVVEKGKGRGTYLGMYSKVNMENTCQVNQRPFFFWELPIYCIYMYMAMGWDGHGWWEAAEEKMKYEGRVGIRVYTEKKKKKRKRKKGKVRRVPCCWLSLLLLLLQSQEYYNT